MTHELYIQCVIACLIGNVLHVAFKILSMSKDHKVANLEFSVRSYLRDDKWPLIVDAASSFALVYLIDEWIDFGPPVAGKVKSIFVFVGFTGSYVILQLMSVAKSNFRKAVDFKTTKSDQQDGTTEAPTPTKPTPNQ